ncbi:oxalate decarboxylase [Laetiporus sulphureus 93-53]|uniref:Oxalate decarboxylase n=1 Tax=Laetiporus sulphureus 93-53 TaxID=1314785 RepID=A0A165ILK6_9APHY|nr:oxalate decarboxylase [Laetiporus sulphureus 93-53]KZT13247.1 oxalate decarboxylase [Laetiporus sulphureus 93-53]
MDKLLLVLCALTCFGPVVGAPVGDSSSPAADVVLSAAEPSATVRLASDNANNVLWSTTSGGDPQPIRGSLGATILAQQNVDLDRQNPDALAPPTTDHGTIPNIKWPFSLSPNRLQTGGWARQQNVQQMPIAKSMAGVDMRLEAGAIRELHWHKTSEWAYVMNGHMQVTAVDQLGRNFVGNVGPGDLWFFPPGIPHSLQATNETDEGAEFLLVFDNGEFSDDSTFLLTEWMAHTPKDIIAKNFGTSMQAFDRIPGEQLYIFPGIPPSPDASAVEDPQGQVPQSFTYKLSDVTPTQLAGGTVRYADSRTFTVATTTAVAELTVEPGGMRELHWHPTQDEWMYIISGTARVTEFAASATAQTYDFSAGDIGFVPATYGHYVENIGNSTLHYLEIFNTDIIQDISLNQWLALTPPELVKEHLQLSDETIAKLSKVKPVVVGPNSV